jgi:hypothetical protein
MVSFMSQRSDHTTVTVMHVTEIVTPGLSSQSFLMISILCFLQMMHFNLDPFTFSSPDMIPLINLFLREKIVSLSYTHVNQRPRFM